MPENKEIVTMHVDEILGIVDSYSNLDCCYSELRNALLGIDE